MPASSTSDRRRHAGRGAGVLPGASRLGRIIAALLLGAPALAAQQGATPSRPGVHGPTPGAPVPAQQANPARLENALARFDFDTTDGRLQLLQITNKDPALAGDDRRLLEFEVSQAVSDGGWTIVFARRAEYDEAAAGGDQRFRIEADGDHLTSSDGVPLPPVSLVMQPPVISSQPLIVQPGFLWKRWECEVTLGTAQAQETVRFAVEVRWELLPEAGSVEAGLSFSYLGEVPADVVLCRVGFPQAALRRFPDGGRPPGRPHDALVVPVLGGYLLREPTNPVLAFPSHLQPGSFLSLNTSSIPVWSVPLLAYYDEDSGSGLVYASTDEGQHWKQLGLQRAPDNPGLPGGRGRLVFNLAHVPADVFDSESRLAPLDYHPPYRVRISCFRGDWWDVAEMQRRHLQQVAPWFRGPVGAASNPMPAATKSLVAEMLVLSGRNGDSLDLRSRLGADMTEVLGTGVTSTWYHWHYPDDFDDFFAEGYLPGRPTLAAAVREAQAQSGDRVKLYVNAYAATLTDGSTACGSSVNAALLRNEYGDQQPVTPSSTTGRILCAGTDTWGDLIPRTVLGAAAFTGMAGVHLDYLFPAACFATGHGHPAGGGSWMYSRPMARLAQLSTTGVPALGSPPPCGFLPSAPPVAPPDFLISMEGHVGRWTEVVQIMHRDPTALRILSPGGNVLPHATVIPFFRAVFDNVKIGRTRASASTEINVGRRCWIETLCALRFGQVLHPAEGDLDVLPIFNLRASADYWAWESALASALRDRGLLTWHNGTLRRPPHVQVAPPVGWHPTSVPSVQFTFGLPANHPSVVNEVEDPDYVVATTLQAPSDAGPDADSLAVVLANPWVVEDQADLAVDFDLDLAAYPAWEDVTGSAYSVERFSSLSPTSSVVAPDPSPHFAASEVVQTGEIVWYVFRH